MRTTGVQLWLTQIMFGRLQKPLTDSFAHSITHSDSYYKCAHACDHEVILLLRVGLHCCAILHIVVARLVVWACK
jgi:hypothetical protein